MLPRGYLRMINLHKENGWIAEAEACTPPVLFVDVSTGASTV